MTKINQGEGQERDQYRNELIEALKSNLRPWKLSAYAPQKEQEALESIADTVMESMSQVARHNILWHNTMAGEISKILNNKNKDKGEIKEAIEEILKKYHLPMAV